MKKIYTSPLIKILSVKARLLSGSGSSANMNGGDKIPVVDDAESAAGGRAKDHATSVWDTWE